MNPTNSRTPKTTPKSKNKNDDFKSVARRLGCDEDKALFEKKLGKIAKAKVAVPSGRVK